MTDDDGVLVTIYVSIPRAPCARPGTLRVWPHDPRCALGPLERSSLSDDEVLEVLRRLARGEDPGVDLEAHRPSEAEWAARRRPLARVADPERRRRRKALSG